VAKGIGKIQLSTTPSHRGTNVGNKEKIVKLRSKRPRSAKSKEKRKGSSKLERRIEGRLKSLEMKLQSLKNKQAKDRGEEKKARSNGGAPSTREGRKVRETYFLISGGSKIDF